IYARIGRGGRVGRGGVGRVGRRVGRAGGEGLAARLAELRVGVVEGPAGLARAFFGGRDLALVGGAVGLGGVVGLGGAVVFGGAARGLGRRGLFGEADLGEVLLEQGLGRGVVRGDRGVHGPHDVLDLV
ncbi:MAG: hypothetical protein ACK56I_01205, partial [bacterium]